MQKITSFAALGLALLSGASSAALAGGDWPSGGSSKDGYISDGLPVPAPAPIPNFRAEWYLRGDVGYGFSGKPKSTLSGQTLGNSDGSTGAINPFGVGCGICTTDIVNNPLFSSDDGLLTGGVGFGYYWSSRIRTVSGMGRRETTTERVKWDGGRKRA